MEIMSNENIKEREIDLDIRWKGLDYLSKNVIASYIRDMQDVKVDIKPVTYTFKYFS